MQTGESKKTDKSLYIWFFWHLIDHLISHWGVDAVITPWHMVHGMTNMYQWEDYQTTWDFNRNLISDHRTMYK